MRTSQRRGLLGALALLLALPLISASRASGALIALRGGQALSVPSSTAGNAGPASTSGVKARSSSDILAEILASKVREARNLVVSALGLVAAFILLLRLLGGTAVMVSVPILQAILQHEVMVAASKDSHRGLQPAFERQHWLSFTPAVVWCDSRAVRAGSSTKVPIMCDATVMGMLGLGVVGCLHQWQSSGALRYHVSRFVLSVALQLLVTMPASAVIACSRFGLFWVAMPALTVAIHEAVQKLGDNFMGATPLSRLRPSLSLEGYILASLATFFAAHPLATKLASLQWISRTSLPGFEALQEPQRQLFAVNIASRVRFRVTLNTLTLHALVIAFIVSAAVPIGTMLVAAARRSLGVRDFSSPHLVRIPAHGGFLDRFASQLATAITVFVYIKCFAPSLVAWIAHGAEASTL